ncbi:MAG: alpha/beta fold hydrolase [Pseudanabaenaceae cyanobacterium SKYGB_i_bin29]|nr:alpha/beta fold hydrolase [Pseudanabaenaceae cyanobacterium SKYG29]MDW8420421.1 alpha/beta fold hydrolase [Pseudanabaenaceae cyanobacterium SKYGB_i_bin29]
MTLTQPLLNKSFWHWHGHKIAYTVQGCATAELPIVLLHGFGASIGHWRKNIPVLARHGYRVYALDLLGFGASAKPDVPYSMELWQELVQDFWAAHIHTPAVWIGNSIGALLALMVVTQNPSMAMGGVLLNAAGGLNHRPEELHFPLKQIMAVFTYLVSSPTTGEWVFNWVRQKHRIRATLAQVYCHKQAITDELVEMLHTPSLDPGARIVFSRVLTAPPGPRPEALLPNLRVPLLVLWGEADPWTPLKGAQVYRQWAKSKDITVIPLPQTGHCPHDERPELVNPLLLDWLQKFSPA